MDYSVVIHTQVSSYDAGGRAHLLSDSNFSCAQNQAVVTALALDHRLKEIFVVVPKATTVEDMNVAGCTIKALLEQFVGVKDVPVSICPMESGGGAMEDRFDFNFREAVGVLEAAKAKAEGVVLWLNDAGKVTNWRAAAQGRVPMVILTYLSWWDDPPKAPVPYLSRQVDGMVQADANFVNSWWTSRMVSDTLLKRHLPLVRTQSFHLMPLGACMSADSLGNFPATGQKYLVYNHRVSKFPYYADALRTLARALKDSDGWRLVFTNPSAKEQEQLLEIAPELERVADFSMPPSYPVYCHLLARSWGSVALFGEGAMWSMSVAESLALGVPTFFVARDGLSELWPYGGYPFAGECAESTVARLSEYMKLDRQHLQDVRISAQRAGMVFRDTARTRIGINSSSVLAVIDEKEEWWEG